MRILHFAWALLALSSAALAQPAKPPSTSKLASDYISRELGARMNVLPGTQLQPDKASKNSYSPEQMAAVRAVFGNENPLRVKRLPAGAGKRSYSITLPARQYQDDTETLAWEQGNMLAGSAPNGTITFTGSMQSVTVAGETGRVEMTGVRFNTSQQRNYWGGKVRAEIGRISHTPVQGKDAAVSMEDFRYGSDVKLKGKYYEGRSDIMIGRFLVAGHSVDKLHIGTSLRKFDAATLAELRKEMLAIQAGGSPAEDPKRLLARFIPYIKRLAMHGAVVDISDFSASYKGHQVAMTASLSMPDASDADFKSGNAIMKKLSGKVDIAVPLPLLREIARNFADTYNRGKEKPDVPNAKLAEQIYESMLGKAIANKYARIDQDKLRATIELQKGVLLVNGQSMPLETLLAALDKDDGSPPPADTSAPVPLSMRGRGLEVAHVFALNGDQQGLFDLCERHMNGIGVPADTGEGMKWCNKAVSSGSDEAVKLLARRQLDGRFNGDFAPVLDKLKKQADVALSPEAQFLMSRLTDDREQAAAYLRQAAEGGNPEAMAQLPGVKGATRSRRTAWQLAMDEQGGYYDLETFRFDAAKRRHLRLSLLEARKHEKWMPVANVCLGAMLPSDSACIWLQGDQEQGSVTIYSNLVTQGDAKDRKIKVLESQFKLGEPIDLVVYTDKSRAYFVVNGGKALVQEIGYPVETLSLTCSGAKCDFQFQGAPE